MLPSELDCEEAVAYLEKCCPTFHPTTLRCVQTSGCGSEVPAITSQQSSCIRGKSCEALRDLGICAEASEPSYESGPYVSTSSNGEQSGGNPASTNPEICQ